MFTWLIVHTVVTAAMAVLVAAACRFFRRGPAVRHLLWLIVLLKFLTPPVVSWPWSLPLYASAPRPPSPSSAPEAATAQVRTIIIDEEPATDIAPSLPDAPPAAPAAPPAADPPALASEPAAAPAFSWDWLPTAAVCLWIAGGAVVALRNAGRIYRWRRRLARGLPAPESLTELVRELAETMGVRPPRLVVLAGVASPMVWGFGAPRLIWPLGLEDRLPAEGQRVVLLHELAHLRRRDHWIGWLLLAGACVWWWHPLFWWVRRRLTQEAELACDALVVAAAPDGRRAYAEALLEVSQRLASTAALPALGAASGRRDLERRLVMIMKGPAGRRLSWAGLVGVGMLGLLALPAWTLGEDPRTSPAVVGQPIAPGGAPAGAVDAGGGAPAALGGAPMEPAAADADRDAKIRELERKVERLLKEIQDLRGGAAQTNPNAALGGPGGFVATGRATGSGVGAAAAGAGESSGEVITLTRVTYKLKTAAAADALATLLTNNVRAVTLETKVDGESLTVTTTPESQEAIGQFIGLIQGKTPPRSGMMGPGGFPGGGMSGPGGMGGFIRGGGMMPGPGGPGNGPMGGAAAGGTFGPGPGGPPAGGTNPFGPGPGGTGGPRPGGPTGPPPGGTPPPGTTSSGPDRH